MLDTKKLLQQQLAASTKTRKTPAPVTQSFATGQTYSIALRRLVREIRKDINERLTPLLAMLAPQYQADAAIFTTDAYLTQIANALAAIRARWSSPEAQIAAWRIARQFVRTADDVNRRKFDKTMNNIGVNVFADNPTLVEFLETAAFDNARLIKSIPDQYLTQVESIVMTNVRAGNRSSAITKLLSKQFGITDRRAKFIARDQTAKINGELVKKRQVAVGFEYFQWVTSDDERVRDRHDELADKVTAYGRGVYRWDNLPISDDGTPIFPGQDYGCRCNARPVSQAEVDANVKAGLTRPGVKR